MKNIIKNTLRKSSFFIALSILIAVFSCDKYLDVDTDTDSPVIAPITQLLPNVELGVSSTNDFNNLSSDNLIVYTHQGCQREAADQYGLKANDVIMNNEWNNTYLVLTDIETLISQSTESGDLIYLGIAQVLKAYMMSVTVDLWGDVPYSEATQLETGIVSPMFDDQEVIYQDLLDLISTGKANINSGEGLVPSTDDLFYGGSITKWTRFANTLKFKLYNQIRLTPLFNQTEFSSLVTENNFFKSSADDFEFKHTATLSPRDERNSLFLASYGGTQFSYYQSPWFYEILKGWNPDIHTGNADPRIPYYFVNQLQAGEFPSNGNTITGDPKADYWDASTGFHSIRFGSIGPDRDGNSDNDSTFPGIFPCGGRYDDGSGPSIDINSGTGVAPHRILTYDEFLYIQAELILKGVLPGDASAKLTEAMTASFKKLDEIVKGTGTSQTVPVLSGTEAVTDFMDNIIAEYDAADNEKKLEIIMTQKWVATFGDPMDQYNDYRRTGYPVLADPLGSSPEYQLDNADAWPLIDNLTTQDNSFQQSIFWPQVEINTNQNAPTQKDPSIYKIFWAQ